MGVLLTGAAFHCQNADVDSSNVFSASALDKGQGYPWQEIAPGQALDFGFVMSLAEPGAPAGTDFLPLSDSIAFDGCIVTMV